MPTFNTHLVESNTRSYVNYMLMKSHKVRVQYYNFFFNTSLFIAFVVVVGGSLYYKWRSKESESEKATRQLMKRNYVIQRLNQYNHALKNDGAYNTPLSANTHLFEENNAENLKILQEAREEDIKSGVTIATNYKEREGVPSMYATPWSAIAT